MKPAPTKAVHVLAYDSPWYLVQEYKKASAGFGANRSWYRRPEGDQFHVTKRLRRRHNFVTKMRLIPAEPGDNQIPEPSQCIFRTLRACLEAVACECPRFGCR